MQSLAQRLREMREAAGLTQSALGRLLDPERTEGAAQRWTSARERGDVPITVADAAEWAALCGYRAALLTVPADTPAAQAVDALGALSAGDLEAVLLLADALPRMEPAPRQMLLSMLRSAASSARSEAG